MVYHICCSTDDNYAQHCGVMLNSFLINNRTDGVTFIVHVLIGSLDIKNKERLKEIVDRFDSIIVFDAVDESRLDGVQFRQKRPLTRAAYYRILLSSIIDESVKKILYLDSDMIVLRNLTSLYEINLDGYALAAVEDTLLLENNHRMQLSLPQDGKYFCSGIMLVNLDYWRKNDSEEKLLAFSKRKRNKIYYHDQDALNAVFRNVWFSLPHKWNRFNLPSVSHRDFTNRKDRHEFYHEPMLIHYFYPKPWTDFPFIPFKKYYIQYLASTPWKNSQPIPFNAYRDAFHYLFVKKVYFPLKDRNLGFLFYPIVLVSRFLRIRKSS